MIINLHEIPQEGQSWILNRNTGELNEILRDLIGNIPFTAEFTILPLQPGTFDLKGFIRTEIPESCSRCGQDFQFQVNQSFHELLMPELGTPRDAKFAKANHYSDQTNEGPSVVEYLGNQFNAGEYFHEIVALSEPANPAPEEDEQGRCRLCLIPVKNQSFGYEEPMPEKESPFAVLKKMKM
jgi:uncharacterized protein